MVKLKSQIGNNASHTGVLKLTSNSSSKSKNTSLATLVLKKDQIKMLSSAASSNPFNH